MSGNNWTSVKKEAFPLSNAPPHKNQVANEEMHVEKLSAGCNVCLEENNFGKCEHIEKNLQTQQHCKANSSFTQSVINMTGMLIGLGQLSTPYSLENGGWVSIFLLVGLGVICTYTACLLGKCLEKNPRSLSYIDIGQQAFGTKGKVIATIFVYIEIFMGLVSYTISLHDNLNTAFTGISVELPHIHLPKSELLTVIAALVTLPSLWIRNLSSISFLSIGGILMSFLIFITVISTAIFGAVKANYNIPVLNLNKIPHVSGLYIFSYAGHVVFPTLYKDMKDPSRYMKVAIVSFTAVTSLYTVLAFTGAKMFGPNVNSQFTLSMPPYLVYTKIAVWATVLTPMTKYALQFAPFAVQLEHNFPSFLNSKTKLILRGIIGSFLLMIILVLALSVPYFQYVLSLTGSFVSVTESIVLPCIFYTKICLPQLSKPLFSLNILIIAIGASLSIFGTVSSLKSLIEIIQTATLTHGKVASSL